MAPARRINLLPPELAERRKARRFVGMLGVAGAVLLLLLGVVYVIQRGRLSDARQNLAQQQQQNDVTQRQVNELQQFASKRTELQMKQALVTALSRSEVLWSGVLQDVSLVVPADDWLTAFTGTTTPPTPGQTSVGQITVSGCTLIPPDGDYLNIAQFLVQIAKPLAFGDPFLTRAEKAKSTAGVAQQCPVGFNASLQITPQALRVSRGKERKI